MGEVTVEEVMVMLVRDLMVPTVLTVSPNDPVSDVGRSMRDHGDAAAVVTENENVVGLLTEKELAHASNDSAVKEAMCIDCAVIAPSASLTDAARAMADKSQGFIPVVDSGLLVGILSLTDIRRWARDGSDGGRDEVQKILTLSVGGYESQPPRT
jgi:acetoin utilization protein AcuB